MASKLKGRSINSSFRAYRKALLVASAVLAVLILIVLVNTQPAAENITKDNSTAGTSTNESKTDAGTCSKYAADKGSNDANGTEAAPFKTAQKLVDSLRPGQTGCLRKGVYTDSDKMVIFKNGGRAGNRIVLRSYPGERATFRGMIEIPDGSNYITVRNMRLDGSYGPVGSGYFKNDRSTKQSVRVWGDNVNVLRNNITNRRPNGDPNLAGSCILLGSSKATAVNAIFRNNRIHHCGQLPKINREHGIYASHSVGAKIQNNLIFSNADRGIQLYSDAQKTLVSGNVVDSNGENIVFGGSGNSVSSDNTVRNNVISDSRDGWNVSGNWSQTREVGQNNTFYDNCVWTSNKQLDSGINPEEQGFDAYDNLVSKPAYVDSKAGNFKLDDNSPCRTVLDK